LALTNATAGKYLDIIEFILGIKIYCNLKAKIFNAIDEGNLKELQRLFAENEINVNDLILIIMAMIETH
jgi:predicted nucleotidyltransferase